MENKNENIINQENNTPNSVVTEQPVTQPQVMQQPNPEKKKKSLVPLIIGICLLGLVLLGLILGLIIPNLLVTKKKVVKKEVATVFKITRETVQEADKRVMAVDLNKEKIGMEGNLSIKSEYKTNELDLTKLKDYKLSFKGAFSKEYNEANLSIKLSKDKDILDANMYMNKNMAYFNLGEVFDKTITNLYETEIKDLNTSSIDYKEIDKLIGKTESIITNNIKDQDINKTKEVKEINGKTKTYTKVSYKVNPKEQVKLVLKEYKNDKEALKILSNLYSMSEKEVVDNINDILEDTDDIEEETIYINVYLDGLFNHTKAIELESEEMTILAEIKGNTYEFEITQDDTNMGSGILDLNKKTLKYKMDTDYQKVTFELEWKNKSNVKGLLKVSNNYMEYNLEFNANTKVTNKEMSNALTIKFNEKMSQDMISDDELDTESIDFEINLDYTIKKGESVEKMKTTNKVSYEDLSDDDMNTIYSNLSDKLQVVINDVAPGMNSEQYRKLF